MRPFPSFLYLLPLCLFLLLKSHAPHHDASPSPEKVVSPASENAKAFLHRCGQIFYEDPDNGAQMHLEYLRSLTDHIYQHGTPQLVLELDNAILETWRFAQLESPAGADRLRVCLALEPIMLDESSVR